MWVVLYTYNCMRVCVCGVRACVRVCVRACVLARECVCVGGGYMWMFCRHYVTGEGG